MPRSPAFAGVVLAAGNSSRMGKDKALLTTNGETFLAGAIRRLSQVCDLVIVVTGRNADVLRPVVYENAGFLVINREPERGQFSSLKIGLQEVMKRGRDTAFIALVDRPAPGVQTLQRLQEIFMRSNPEETWAVVPEYQGRHGHPFIAAREMIEVFLRAADDATARDVEHTHQKKILYLPVGDPNVVANINTPEEYESWKLAREAR
jgi:molybdenum cofactor cytidylyltransferase